MRHAGLLTTAIVLLIVGAIGLIALQLLGGGPVGGRLSPTGQRGPTATIPSTPASPALAVGQGIFDSGIGSDGLPVALEAPAVSLGALRRGGGGCASCHGADGHGATVNMMMMGTITAPDITYPALAKAGFTDTTIARAVREGLDESGAPLHAEMPRWQLSDADMAALLGYLKSLTP
jgi:mono/diheme cytochrome c family protein